METSKFLGMGLKRLIGVSLFVMIFFVIMKVIFTKYEVKGVSEIVQAA